MIEAFLMIAGITTIGATASAAGWFAGKRRGTSDAERGAEHRLAAMVAQRDTAQQRGKDAQKESARFKALCLVAEPFAAAPVYNERTSPRDAEELARLLRGLMLIDDVVLADGSGLPLTREDTRESSDLAAVAPYVLGSIRRLAQIALPVAQISFETFGAVHVCARPLLGRAAGALLLVRTTSQRANPLAVDAVAHAAAKTASDVGPDAARSLAGAGSNQRVSTKDPRFTLACGLLEREVGREFSAVALALDGEPVFSAAKNGPSPETRSMVSAELDSLQDRIGRTLRAPGIARVEIQLHGGDAIGWSSLGTQSRLSAVTFSEAGAGSHRRLDRLLGSVRRAIGNQTSELEGDTR